MYLKTLIFFLSLLCFTNVFPQKQIEGVIPNYEDSSAEIILPSRSPRIIGTVSENGTFNVQLESDMAKEVTKSMEEANEKSEFLRIMNETVGRTFYCDSEEVKVTNGEVTIETITLQGSFFIGVMEEKRAVGKLILASSEAFANTYFALGKEDFVTGYYIDYYYVEEDASSVGICKTKSYTLDMKDTFYYTHEYNIDLKKGWNMVKIEVTEVYKDQDGNIRPLQYRMSTIKELPEDVQFIFTPGNKL